MLRDRVVILIGLYLNEVAMGLDLDNARYLYHSNLDGYLNNTNVLHNGISRSKAECAISCEGRQPMCTSFFYVKNSGECKLHSIVFTSITGLTIALSAKFFERVMCLDGWIYFQGSCYLFLDERYSFNSAQVFCEQQSSNMVHIEGSDENNFLKNYVSQLYKWRSYWIGMTDILVEDVWRWLDTNTTLTYDDWYPGEPGGGRYVHCGTLWREYDFQWASERCHIRYRPICERRSL